jgi:type II secretory pathway pseudopilin PulG
MMSINRQDSEVRGQRSEVGCRRLISAFTLLEVMIATAIFFICIFAILGLVTNSLRNAQVLQQHDMDLGMAAAVTRTNRFTEGTRSGDFEDIAPGSFPGYAWEATDYEVLSNGLWQTDLTVTHQVKGKTIETKMSILSFAPESKPGMGFGGGLRR